MRIELAVRTPSACVSVCWSVWFQVPLSARGHRGGCCSEKPPDGNTQAWKPGRKTWRLGLVEQIKDGPQP